MFFKYLSSAAFAACLAGSANADKLMAFDVAEDHTRFIFASTPVFDDGMPAFGNPFVTQGYIYPEGTLSDGEEGVRPDGSPAYPELVLGTWTCDGWFVGEGMRTTEGTMLISRQIYEFDDGDLLITQGPEGAKTFMPVQRAITGGAGAYAGTTGQMTQVMLGMSDGFGVRLQIELDTGRDEARRGQEDGRTGLDGFTKVTPVEARRREGAYDGLDSAYFED
ncbi:hypothetical protein AADZ90_009645 [Aestuariibius sp. 2305UL40-4]|uniref:hypothetical protein n=1 Tax=Aestuariibius violaceus TaxID=3234132 RepID=UPI00345E797D